MKKYIFLFLLVFSFSYADILDKLEKKLSQISSITAQFKQQTFMEGLDQPDEYEGKLFITKPDTVKLEYFKPVKQIYYLKGNELIVYSPEEKQAVRTKLSDQFIMLKIFKTIASGESLKSLFKLEKNEKKGTYILLILSPKDQKDIKKFTMLLSDDLTIKKMTVWDKEGNKIVIDFYDFRYGRKLLNLYIKIPKDTEWMEY
ncbi:outer membrane lipoprotein carrier protein LolA [Persephonella sp.]|uniref:LolA family protein n=1 Tax=Persephonella sp. TaxID=2060922 RepID=UPI002627796C|nr:outer membrane lipoprotein carrier protein LolA [Persephonella sp.]